MKNGKEINYKQNNKMLKFTPTREAVGQKIRNQISFNAINEAHIKILFALERYENPRAPEKVDSRIVDMMHKLADIIKQFLIEDAAYNITTKIDNDILKIIEND